MFLGIDTSCYTTSAALVSGSEIISDTRCVLDVKQGDCGLRQSDAVFKHIKNFPVLAEQLGELRALKAVAVSSAPRRKENSYMPVFTAGMAFAKTLASALGVPIFETSHQEGHIMAAAKTAGFYTGEKFLSVHLSGGTTEILLCREDENGFECEILGKTLDISAGQLIDRVGVAGGESFPCGRHMDARARISDIKFAVSVSGCDMNFSGAETQAKRAISDENRGEIYYAVFEAVAKSLEKSLKFAAKQSGAQRILMTGGVSANSHIRGRLCDYFGDGIFFAPPKYSTDNAVGTAYICQKRWETNAH